MSSRSRTLAIVLVLELVVGAIIWFANAPDDAVAGTTEPPTATSASATPAPPKAAAKPDCKVWVPGARVVHSAFGDGRVVSADDKGKLATVEVKFDERTEKVTGVTLDTWRKPLTDDLIPIGILILVISLVAMFAASITDALICVAILAPSIALFWFLVKAMARIQMPERPH